MTPQHPAAPEGETDASGCSSPGWCGGREGHYRDCPVGQAANGLTDPEHEVLADAFAESNRSEFMDTDLDLPILRAVERIVAERLRVVEGERDAVVEVGAYAQQKEATARAVNNAARMAQVAARRTRELAAMTARAKSAGAAHAALVAGIEALAETATQRAYFQIGVEKCLTIEPLNMPGDGDPRARVPGHWRAEAEARAVVPVTALRALLAGGGA